MNKASPETLGRWWAGGGLVSGTGADGSPLRAPPGSHPLHGPGRGQHTGRPPGDNCRGRTGGSSPHRPTNGDASNATSDRSARPLSLDWWEQPTQTNERRRASNATARSPSTAVRLEEPLLTSNWPDQIEAVG